MLMVFPSLHLCKPSPTAQPAGKPCRWMWQGTSRAPAGASPGPGKPLSLRKDLQALPICIAKCKSPVGSRRSWRREKGLQLGSRAAKNDLLVHREKPGGAGLTRCLGHVGGPGCHQCICGSPMGDQARGGRVPRRIPPCTCRSLEEEREATGTACSRPHWGA